MTTSAPLLLVPDLHQNVAFLEAVEDLIARERFHRVIFIGDYFDPYVERLEVPSVVRGYCRRLIRLMEDLGDRGTFLWGNHDFPYYLAAQVLRQEIAVPNEWIECSLQFTWEKAALIEEATGPAFWNRLQLLTEAGPFQVSHAGLHPYWLGSHEPRSVRLKVRQAWQALMHDLSGAPGSSHEWLIGAGRARGGTATVGGPLWLDWEKEFEDIPGLPQLVGHTRGEAIRRKGDSWCIDCGQASCTLLHGDRLEERGLMTGAQA